MAAKLPLAGRKRAASAREVLDDATRPAGQLPAPLASQALTTLGDALVNPETVLTWLALFLQVPTAMVASLVPVGAVSGWRLGEAESSTSQ